MFLDFLRSIPGRNESTLKYISRYKDVSFVVPGEDLLEDYINCAQVKGNEFMIDVARVSTYIYKFLYVNTNMEAVLP